MPHYDSGVTSARFPTPWPTLVPMAGVLLILVALAVLRSALGTALDSFTVDEPWHIVAGTSYARTGDFRLNPEHPPLVKRWVGAAMPAEFQLRPATALSEKAQERDFVEETMFLDNDAARAQVLARRAMWGLHAIALLILAGLLWRAFGWPWAAASLAVLAIEPTVAAHLPVVMTDLPLALTLVITAISAGLLASTWQWRWVLACGVAAGLTLGTKHSALAGLAGITLALLVAAHLGWGSDGARALLRRLGQLLAVGALAIAVLWLQYDGRFHASPQYSDRSDTFNRPMADKIAELKLPGWRTGIELADRYRLLPRAYLWGLADTVRTGVEGRGISEHLIWGRLHQGEPPWFSWPAIIASKMPLAILALALLGTGLLWRSGLPVSARWAGTMLTAGCLFHMVALIGSGGVWGGVRHALPVLVGLAILAGGALALAWQRGSMPMRLSALALLVLALATTVREPRLWEYHTELVGGSHEAHRFFDNEGLDLGQRFAEVRAFHDREIAPSGLPLYSDYWMGEIQTRAAGLRYRRRVENLNDDNLEGSYEGWFLYPMSSTLPWPTWDWDPAEVFAGLELVARFGQVGVWKGTQLFPRARADSMIFKVNDYIYKEGGDDWALVARRLEEVASVQPHRIDVAVELSNAYLRLGQGDAAIAALRRLLDQDKLPVDTLVARQARDQIQRIAASADPATLELMRNPWME